MPIPLGVRGYAEPPAQGTATPPVALLGGAVKIRSSYLVACAEGLGLLERFTVCCDAPHIAYAIDYAL